MPWKRTPSSRTGPPVLGRRRRAFPAVRRKGRHPLAASPLRSGARDQAPSPAPCGKDNELLRPCGRRRGSLVVLQIGYSYQTATDSPRAETVAIKQIAQILYELLSIEDLAANEDVDGFHALAYARDPGALTCGRACY